MSVQKVKAMLDRATSLRGLWNNWVNWFYSGKWLKVRGGRVVPTPTGIILDIRGRGGSSTPASFAGVVFYENNVMKLKVFGGNAQCGSVDTMTGATSTVLGTGTKYAWLELNMKLSEAVIKFGSSIPESEALTLNLPLCVVEVQSDGTYSILQFQVGDVTHPGRLTL